MIAWVLYSVLVTAFCSAAAVLLQPLARWARVPARALWIGAIAVSMGLSAWAALAPAASTIHPATRTPTVSADRRAPVTPSTGTSWIVTGGHPAAASARQAAPMVSDRLTVCLLLAAALVGAGWFARSALRLARLRQRWTEARIAGANVLVSPDVGPAVVGVLRTRIVVPAWVAALDEEEQRLVVAHEEEHQKAGDPALLWTATLLACLLPWNVALWLALRGLRQGIELDCDARVLRRRVERRRYCALLLDVGERTLAPVAPLPALAEPATGLERRIEAMTTIRRLRDTRTLVPAVGATMLLAAACWAPRPALDFHADSARGPGGQSSTSSGVSRADRIATGAHGAGGADLVEPAGDASAPPTTSPVDDRIDTVARAGAMPTPVSDTSTRNAAAMERSALEHQARVDAIADSVILAAYPELTRRPAGTPAFLALVLDDRDRLLRHALAPNPAALPNDLAEIMFTLGIDTISARTLAVGITARNRWHVTVGHAVEALGPVHGHTEMRAWMASPLPQPLRRVPYERIVDSVARARAPDAFEKHEGTYAIAMLLEQDGRVASYAEERLSSLAWSKEPVDSVLTRMLGSQARRTSMSGGTFHLLPGHVAIVWGVAK